MALDPAKFRSWCLMFARWGGGRGNPKEKKKTNQKEGSTKGTGGSHRKGIPSEPAEKETSEKEPERLVGSAGGESGGQAQTPCAEKKKKKSGGTS